MTKWFWLPIIFVMLVGCNPSDSEDDSDDDTIELSAEASRAFPEDLMVSSPTQRISNSQYSSGAKYDDVVDRIDHVRRSVSHLSSRFDPNYFFSNVVDAECFGPAVEYEDHPDGTASNSGTLPSGDVGIWLETMPSGEACASAQLNTQMKGASSRVMMSLIAFGGLNAVAAANSVSLPSAGNSITLTTQMNARGFANTTFNTVTLAQSSANIWSYVIDFDYTNGSSVTNNIVLTLEHAPGSDSDHYEGILRYQMDDFYDPSGNCTASSGTGADITHNGSLHYIRNGDAIKFQHRYGMLCGHGETAFTSAITSTAALTHNALNPNDTTDPWKNNFSILTANFDKDDKSGSYAYTWQAGDNDAASRILLVGLNANQTGESYYGYGSKVQTTTVANITGFYCNWAGEGSVHTVHQLAQRQHLTMDTSDYLFKPTNSGASDIIYSPNDSCSYSVASGTFRYDRDNDNLLTDETEQTAFVYSTGAPTGYLTLDLMDVDYGGTTYTNIMDVITARGYTLPTYP